jgi:heme/copper-type cytochrome/quinol oxidase subunit 3
VSAGAAPASIDVAGLPSHAFGARAPLWWGVALMVAIEATAMSILLVSVFYLRGSAADWPLRPIGGRAFALAVVQLVLLVGSYAPMVASVRAARRRDLPATRRWLALATSLGAAMLSVRAVELPYVPVRWDADAFGSLFWMTFGLHVTHVLTGVLESAMLLGLLWRGPVEPKHFGDVDASALLWYFTVIEWVPAFLILYLSGAIVR